jgi:hypothetical protein
MTASVTTGAGKTIRKDTAFEVFAKRSLDIRRWRVHVTLPIKLAAGSEREPGFEVISNSAIKQALLRMTGLIQRGSLFGRGWIVCAIGLMRNRVQRMWRRSRGR